MKFWHISLAALVLAPGLTIQSDVAVAGPVPLISESANAIAQHDASLGDGKNGIVIRVGRGHGGRGSGGFRGGSGHRFGGGMSRGFHGGMCPAAMVTSDAAGTILVLMEAFRAGLSAGVTSADIGACTAANVSTTSSAAIISGIESYIGNSGISTSRTGFSSYMTRSSIMMITTITTGAAIILTSVTLIPPVIAGVLHMTSP